MAAASSLLLKYLTITTLWCVYNDLCDISESLHYLDRFDVVFNFPVKSFVCLIPTSSLSKGTLKATNCSPLEFFWKKIFYKSADKFYLYLSLKWECPILYFIKLFECRFKLLLFRCDQIWHILWTSVFALSIWFQPPKVRCDTRIWHPNINEDGEVCLSLLRQNSLDSMGWAPTRKLKDMCWGLNSLFSVSLREMTSYRKRTSPQYGRVLIFVLNTVDFRVT